MMKARPYHFPTCPPGDCRGCDRAEANERLLNEGKKRHPSVEAIRTLSRLTR